MTVLLQMLLPELVGTFIHGWGSSGMEQQECRSTNQSRRPYENWLCSSFVQGLVQQGQRGWFGTREHCTLAPSSGHCAPVHVRTDQGNELLDLTIQTTFFCFFFFYQKCCKGTPCTNVQEQRIKESLTFDGLKDKGSLIPSKKNNITMICGSATALFSTTINNYGKKYKTQSGKLLTWV